MSIPPSDIVERAENLLSLDSGGHDDALRNLQEELSRARRESNLDIIEQVMQVLGTAVGKQKQWQTPFRETGILTMALEYLEAEMGAASLKRQYLRVIGNCVADNDLNREVVTKHLNSLIKLITDSELSTISLIVLFNLCNDFDPAKAAASSLRLDTITIAELCTHRIRPEALDYAVDLLTWTTGKLTAEQLKDESAVATFQSLLSIALEYDEDHYHEYVAILVHYLQDLEFQEKICTPGNVDHLVVLMFDFESRLTSEEIEAVFNELTITKTGDTTPSEETTVLLLSQLVNAISSISATNAFATSIEVSTDTKAFNLTTPVIERIRTTLAPPTDKSQSVASPLDQSPSTMAACVVLGNLATSDKVCIEMVKNWRVHVSLKQILESSKHSALLYAAAGFLRHLAFPEGNRTTLGTDGVIEACQHVLIRCTQDAAVRGEVAALLGKLVTNNFTNIRCMVSDTDSQTTCLQTLVSQSLQPATPLPSTSMKNLSIESARTIVSILRYLARSSQHAPHATDISTLYRTIFSVPHISRPIARLVRQRFYAEARAEGLLGLGLMAQSSEGAAQVMEEIKEDEGLLDAIKEMAEGKEGNGGEGGGGREYQNAMVLLQALQNNGGVGADGAMRERIVELQEGLGKMMV